MLPSGVATGILSFSLLSFVLLMSCSSLVMAAFGSNCTDSNCTSLGETCDSTSNSCICNKGYTVVSTVCKADLNYACASSYYCYVSYAECQVNASGTCQCKSGYRNVNGVCKADLGSECNQNSFPECTDVNARCSGRCECMIYYYNSSNHCTTTSYLQVQNLVVATVMETSLFVQWEKPVKYDDVNKYNISWKRLYASEFFGTEVNKVNTSANLTTNLIAAAAYNITVTSYVSPAINISTSIQQATKPIKPDSIDVNGSNFDLEIKDLMIAWHYSGTITGIDIRFLVLLIDSRSLQTVGTSTAVTATYVTFPSTSLMNGYWYNVSITAMSEGYTTVAGQKRVNSSLFIDSVKTVAKVPDPPLSLTCLNATDRYINLTWIVPNNPNGDIRYYNITVDRTSPNPGINNVRTPKDDLQYTVMNLTAGSFYTFEVYTVNEKYQSQNYAVARNCETTALLADKPENLAISALTSRSGKVTWNKPSNLSGVHYGYSLQIRNGEGCTREVIWKCNDCEGIFPTLTSSGCTFTLNQNKSSSELQNLQSYEALELSPDMNYTVTVSAITKPGRGQSDNGYLVTLEEAPQKPYINESVGNIGSTEGNVTWNINGPSPGKTNYTISLIADSPAGNKTFTVFGFQERSFKLTGLEEFWNYNLTVTASTSIGKNESAQVSFKTKEGPPGKVSHLDANLGSADRMYITSQVSWMLPPVLERNGIIKSFYVQQEEINGTNARQLKTINVTALDNEAHTYVETFPVEPEKIYTFTVIAYNGFQGIENKTDYIARAGPPFIPDEQVLEVIPPSKVSGVGQRSFVIEINKDFFMNDSNGKIKDKGLICCKDPICSHDNSTTAATLNVPTYAAARKEGKMKYKLPVPIADLTSLPSGSGRRRKRENNNVYQYQVGTESCDNKLSSEFCNGPLDPDSSYRIIAFVCTNGGCTLSRSYGPFKTLAVPAVHDNGLNAAALGGGIGGGLAVIVIVIIVIFIMRRKNIKREHHKDFKGHSIRRSRPINLATFAEYVEDYHKDSNLKFSAEYEDLKTLSPHHPHEASDTEENHQKNRFFNILPFDHSRVKLRQIDDVPGSDYINANYLPGFTKSREYIACQGPIPATIDDHWRLIWEQNVRVIVMLTQYEEDNRVKCDKYMPLELQDPKQYGNLVVECLTCSSMNSFEYRTLKISLGEKERTIKHFHFLSWRDFSADVHLETMIDFIKQVRSFIQPTDLEGPMIVHCSAGVGRTGTFVTIDFMIQHIDQHGPDSTVDIFNFVLKMRENRTTMVQTEEQYIFIHDCIKEYLNRFKTYENQAFSGDCLAAYVECRTSGADIENNCKCQSGYTTEGGVCKREICGEGRTSNSDSSMDTLAIVGVVCGTVVLISVIVAGTFIIIKKTRVSKHSSESRVNDTYMDLACRTNENPYMSSTSSMYKDI